MPGLVPSQCPRLQAAIGWQDWRQATLLRQGWCQETFPDSRMLQGARASAKPLSLVLGPPTMPELVKGPYPRGQGTLGWQVWNPAIVPGTFTQ